MISNNKHQRILDFLTANYGVLFSASDIAEFCCTDIKSISPFLSTGKLIKKEGIIAVDRVPYKNDNRPFYGKADAEKHMLGMKCFYRWCIGAELDNGGKEDFCPKKLRGKHGLKFYGVDHNEKPTIPWSNQQTRPLYPKI